PRKARASRSRCRVRDELDLERWRIAVPEDGERGFEFPECEAVRDERGGIELAAREELHDPAPGRPRGAEHPLNAEVAEHDQVGVDRRPAGAEDPPGDRPAARP